VDELANFDLKFSSSVSISACVDVCSSSSSSALKSAFNNHACSRWPGVLFGVVLPLLLMLVNERRKSSHFRRSTLAAELNSHFWR
jgi:hypothetical protein